jgi:hypothetical protein
MFFGPMLCLIIALLPGASSGQTCNCPTNEMSGPSHHADTTFVLESGQKIALCGGDMNFEKRHGKQVFSEFVLVTCPGDSILDEWGAVDNCWIEVRKDTLIVETLEYLPIGKHFHYKQFPYKIEKIHYEHGIPVLKTTVNHKIRKYSTAEIQIVLHQYERDSKDFTNNHPAFHFMEHEENLADRLFVAAISGSATARKYLVEFNDKFKPDGGIAERYDDLIAMLALFDSAVH